MCTVWGTGSFYMVLAVLKLTVASELTRLPASVSWVRLATKTSYNYVFVEHPRLPWSFAPSCFLFPETELLCVTALSVVGTSSCRLGWHRAHGDPPASVSQVPGLTACATTARLVSFHHFSVLEAFCPEWPYTLLYMTLMGKHWQNSEECRTDLLLLL